MQFDMLTFLEIALVSAIAFVLYTVARRGIRSLEKKNTMTLQSAVIITGIIKWAFIYTTLIETTPDGEEYRVHLPNNQLFQNAIRTKRGKDTSSLKSALFSKKETPKEKDQQTGME